MKALLALSCLLLPLAATAEVQQASADAMLVRHEFRIAAPLAKAWESLVHPEHWWPSAHTWSGRRESLSLQPRVGGCFCERWGEASAEHGRVILAIPNEALKMNAALGPFLDMAVSGVLSIVLSAEDGMIVAKVSYRVSGDASHRLEQLAPVVDRVIGEQFGAFAAHATAAAAAPPPRS